MTDRGASGKTIANKHGFLSSALNAAVRAGHISSNPAAGQKLPRTERADMVCLSREEFAGLLDAVTEPWRPLVEFLVASGSRWGEATALRPGDIDRAKGTVRITRAWKRTYARGGYELARRRPSGRSAPSTSPRRYWTSSITPASGCSPTGRTDPCATTDSMSACGGLPWPVRA
jgi:integrase